MALTALNPNLLGTDSAGASKLSTAGGLVQLHSTGVFTIANTSANTLFISNTGNVGINNGTPAVLANAVQIAIKANVNGDSMFVAQNSNGLTTAKFGFQYSGGVDNPAIGSYSDHPLVFLTNNTEKMRIDSSGRLLVGTTNGSANLHKYNSSSFGERTSAGIADSDIYQRHVVQINNVFTWTTLLSITPSTAGNTWMRGFVKCTISGHNSGNYNAALLDAVWYLDLNGGSQATTAQVSAGTSSGGGTPGFRVNMSGNVWQLQVQAPNSANRYDGCAFFEVLISHGAGTTATYTIA